jgi:hypothetical protein
MATRAASHREARRVSEDEFIRLAQRPGTVILDGAQSREVRRAACARRGEPELSGLTIDSLESLAPDRDTLSSSMQQQLRERTRSMPSKLPPPR